MWPSCRFEQFRARLVEARFRRGAAKRWSLRNQLTYLTSSWDRSSLKAMRSRPYSALCENHVWRTGGRARSSRFGGIQELLPENKAGMSFKMKELVALYATDPDWLEADVARGEKRSGVAPWVRHPPSGHLLVSAAVFRQRRVARLSSDRTKAGMCLRINQVENLKVVLHARAFPGSQIRSSWPEPHPEIGSRRRGRLTLLGAAPRIER
jgi:hypothetical protein